MKSLKQYFQLENSTMEMEISKTPIKFLKREFLLLFLLVIGCKSSIGQNKVYESDALNIQQLTKNSFVHTSFLKTRDFGNVPCNGMVVINNNEAIIYDTPINNSVSSELIDWIEEKLKCKITTVVITHFHADCLGGLEEFHNRNIPSYANNLTIALARKKYSSLPQIGFDDYFEHNFGNEKVVSQYFGEGHTKDNIIGYFGKDELIFGGCLIKELGAGYGNLEDANTATWSTTVEKIKKEYPKIKIVIPGHGKTGNIELLDYTIEKFKSKQK